ncbi:MAG: hypothetical protein KQA40_01635 [Candidatus Aenigmarchaeota archaeon]|nr:hypothetical protein [Candidatus Aenigmarchaeota archaeon]
MNYKVLFGILILIVFGVSTLAENVTSEAFIVKSQLLKAKEDMKKMIEDGFNVVRYNDTLLIAETEFNSKYYLEVARNETQNYTKVKNLINELSNLKSLAYRTKDELETLKSTIDELSEINITPVLESYEKARADFYSERYEIALKEIEDTYKVISEQQSIQTKLKLFYEITSRTLENFIKTYWKEILITIAIIIILSFISYKRIKVYLLKKKLENLYIRRNSVRNLIANVQRDYFEKGKIDEGTYNIKVRKYGEIIRDINRQIPLIKEELEEIERKIKREQKEIKNKKR